MKTNPAVSPSGRSRLHLRLSFSAALCALLCLAALPGSPAQAAASGGVALSPTQLDSAARQRLLRAVGKARREHPTTFAAVAQLRLELPQLARQQRGRVVSLVRPLRALGQEGLMALLAELAVEAQPRGELSERAWRGWRISLLEAVGSLRDPRAVPVLWAILEHTLADPAVARSAATALARLNDAKLAARLIARLGQGNLPLRQAILPALGECRRLVAASALARLLASAERGSWEEEAALQALGQVGNVGAWRTPAVRRSGEGEAVRRTALQALAAAYPQLSRERREQAYKAVLLVDHPQTREILEAARQGQSGAAREALAQLDDRVARARARR